MKTFVFLSLLAASSPALVGCGPSADGAVDSVQSPIRRLTPDEVAGDAVVDGPHVAIPYPGDRTYRALRFRADALTA